MDKGYLLISRRLFVHPFWKQPRHFSYLEAWLDLIQCARYENNTHQYATGNRKVIFNRGEQIVSLRQLAGKWGWNKNQVSKFLGLLETERMIKRRIAPGNITVLTISKYNHYNPEPTRKKKRDKQYDSGNEQLPHPDFTKFTGWLLANAPYCANSKHFPIQISESQFLELKKQYSSKQIADIILCIENRKDLRKRYTNLYLTTLNWLKKEYEHK